MSKSTHFFFLQKFFYNCQVLGDMPPDPLASSC